MSVGSRQLNKGNNTTVVDRNGKFGTSSLANEHSELEDGEIIDNDVSDHIHGQGKRKRKYKNSKIERETVAASLPKKLVDKPEIIDLKKVTTKSCRHRRSCQLIQNHETPVNDDSWWTDNKSSIDKPDQFELKNGGNFKTRSSNVKCEQLKLAVTEVQTSVATKKRMLKVDQTDRFTATVVVLEDGELPSDSDINSSINEVLSPSGSDMSISSDNSNIEDTAIIIEYGNSGVMAQQVRSNVSGDPDMTQICSSATSQISSVLKPAVDGLNPSAPSFIPRSSSQAVEGSQASSVHTSVVSVTSTCPNTQVCLAQDCQSSDITTPHHNSEMVKDPYSQQPLLCPPGSKLWTASNIEQTRGLAKPISTIGFSDSQVYREYSSKVSGRKRHVDLSAEQTCPEQTDTHRCWHSVTQAPTEVGSLEFTVMSYNILSQELMFRHMHLYDRCKEEDLEWTSRGPAILTQIIAHNADIVCLQEVQEDHWKQDIIVTLEKQGYHGVYKKTDGDKPDGCAILFKGSKFLQLRFVPVEFSKGGILDRSNVGLILLLQPRQEVYRGNVQKICVATTHLLFNPRRGDIKLAQLIVFLAEIDKHAYLEDDLKDRTHWRGASENDSTPKSDKSLSKEKCLQTLTCVSSTEKDIPAQPRHVYCPIILCGDFNSEPFSDLYRFITTGHLKYDDLIARLVCGQQEGRYGDSHRTVGRRLLPAHLSICETCQYIQVLQERQTRAEEGFIKQCPKVNSGQVFHSMNFQSVYTHFVDHPGPREREVSTHHNNCSCTVDYIFYSKSGVGQQKSDNEGARLRLDGSKADQLHDNIRAVSTDNNLNNAKEPVSTDNNLNNAKEPVSTDNNLNIAREPLELLARYRLLTSKEVSQLGFMPNSTLPSDHLCLIAKFMLR